MGRKRYTEEQIACALRQAESGTSVAEISRKLGVSEQAFDRWKKQFADLDVRLTGIAGKVATGIMA
jgi:putative transposase